VNWPNTLSWCRLVGSPWLLPLAWSGQRRWLFIGFVLLGLTDWLDGFLARRWNQVTERGSKLDAVADLVFYPTAAAILAIVFPAYLESNLDWIVVTLLALVVMLGVSQWRCGKIILLHTHLSRAAGVVVFLVVIASFFMDTTLAVRGVALLYTIAFIEAIIIFQLRGAVSPDTRSIFSS
jgi:cardiolipin synthase